MQTLSFTVLLGPLWLGEDGPFVDEVTDLEASPELVRFAHHAHAAGAIELHDVTEEALSEHGVQTQEEAEASLAEAMGEWVESTPDGEAGYWTGPWAEGNRLVFEESQRETVEVGAADVVDISEVLGGEGE